MRISRNFPTIPGGIPRNAAPTNHGEMTKMNTAKSLLFLMVFMFMLPARPAQAQVDLTGEWVPRVYNDGVDIGDYTGIPLNEEGRLRAESWHPEQVDLPENLCRPHPI